MRANIKILGMLFFSFALVACESANQVDGQLIVSKELVIKDTDGTLKNFPEGNRLDATLSMNEQNSKITISTGLLSSVSFNIQNLIKDQMGKFKSSAAESQQNFSTEGEILIKQAEVDASHYESCIYSYRDVYRCHSERDRDGNVQEVCGYEQEPVYGHEWVSETDEVISKNISIRLIESISNDELAKFTGYYEIQRKVISRSYSGSCSG